MNPLRTLPNILTGLRFALVPLLVILLSFRQSTTIAFWAWFVFALAAFTDWLDGYLARKFENETVLGQLMDPLADKILVIAALLMLIPLGRLPAWLCLIIISREVIITGLRGLAATTGTVVAADNLGKLKANFQYYGIGLMIFPLGLLPIPYQYQIAMVLIAISVVLSIWSGVKYIYDLRSVFAETS